MANLVFIGDSLTQWCDWDRRFPKHNVLNLGISGETVEGLLARRDRIRSQINAPDRVFLMTGINNIANGEYDILPSYREIARNLVTWFRPSTIALQSVLPVDMSWVDNGAIKHINRNIEQIAREVEAVYLDIYHVFVNERGILRAGYLSDDGVHLANKGYDAWAGEVEKFLNKSL